VKKMIPHRCWVQTASGAAVDLLNPDPATIHAHDIATALTRQVRFNGHTIIPYTVAEHSVLVGMIALNLSLRSGVSPTTSWRLAILHDAHEAYVGDIVNPVIWLPGIKDEVEALKERVQAAIHVRFGMVDLAQDIHASLLVSNADHIACAIEKRDLLAPSPYPWPGLPAIPAGFRTEDGCDLSVWLKEGHLAGYADCLGANAPP
jgi:hypothetical protein